MKHHYSSILAYLQKSKHISNDQYIVESNLQKSVKAASTKQRYLKVVVINLLN